MREENKLYGGLREGRGFFESVIAKTLVLSITSPPLKKISYICEASLLLSPEEVKTIGLDLEKVKVFHALALSLSNAQSKKRFQGDYYYITYPVLWSFSKDKDNFKKYIEPWYQDTIYHTNFVLINRNTETVISCISCNHILLSVPLLSESGKTHEAEELIRERFKTEISKNKPSNRFSCPGCGRDFYRHTFSNQYVGIKVEDVSILDKRNEERLFFEASNYLTFEGYKQIVNSFVSWALPQTQTIFSKIAKSGLIKEETFRELLMGEGGVDRQQITEKIVMGGEVSE